MKNTPCLFIVGLLVFTSAARAADPDASPVKLSGTYVLIEHYKDVRAPDRIAFQEDNRCTLDIDGKTGVPAKYDARADNTVAITPIAGTDRVSVTSSGSNSNLAITPAAGGELDYQFVQGKMTLKLSRDNQDDLYYGLLPDHPPAVQFSDVVGIVTCHNEGGDSVTEITPDHHFRVLMREFSVPPETGILSALTDIVTGTKRTYVDISADGTCTYADGVIHYTVEHTKSPEPDQSLCDIIIKADSTGIWIIDPTRDQVIGQPRAATFELPPPPSGFTQASQ